MFATHDVIIVFDTDCLLCSAWVHFLLRHERTERLKFVGAWSKTGAALAAQHGLSHKDLQETYLVVEGGRGLTKSDAGVALLRQLKAPYGWLRWAVVILPRPLRDSFYSLVANHRYQWFGRSNNCFVPPAGTASRFIND